MKKLKHGKVLLCAASVILVCVVALVVSIHVAFGAEESRVSAEEILPTPVAGGEGTGATPDVGAQYISGEEAIAAFAGAASKLFDQTVDVSTPTVTFDGEGSHAKWIVKSDTFISYVDALSGEVFYCQRTSGYAGDRITLGEYYSISDSLRSPSGDDPPDMSNSPDSIYIKAALEFANDRLADGRAVDNAIINAGQFIWEASAATGTIEVDVDVLMASGRSYRLVFWGTDQPVLAGYYSFPTQDACRWGYFYEEEVPETATWPEATPTPAPTRQPAD